MSHSLKLLVCSVVTLLLTACLTDGRHARNTSDFLPEPPDYSDTTQWFIVNRQAEADLFYIVSTETGDYTLADGRTCHYADTYTDSLRQPLRGEMLGVERLLSDSLNFFSPYYRQCSLQSYTDDSIVAARIPVPTDDVRDAFRYYLQHLNQGRPFILAGYSQGAIIALDLLREMDDDTYRRMIAAYIIGWPIQQALLDSCFHIRPARSADDTGVTICYNSVRDTTCTLTMIRHSDVAINPVNWHTDTTPAQLLTVPSPGHKQDDQVIDTLTVCLDSSSGLLLVSGYTGNDYVLPLIGHEGNYHSRELWLYRRQLRDNMLLRTRHFLENSTL